MKRLWLRFAAILGGWTLLALILTANQYARLLARGNPSPFTILLKWNVVDHWIWAALTPLVFWTARRLRFARRHLGPVIAAHCLACVAFSLVHISIAMLAGVPRGASATGISVAVLKARLLVDFYSDVWMYWPLVGLWNLLDYQKRYRERAMQALKLESQLAKAQLEALRSQLQPHFLFNTLNSISALMQDDIEAAEDMLADLSYMLRVSLDRSATQEVTLADELHLLEAYIRIQKRRFEGRLQINTEASAETLEAQVPSLLLQPLVENAIRHGLAPLSRGGKIQIASKKDAARLLITVVDDGCGLPPEYQEGIGLRNTRERLRQLYGPKGKLDLRGAPSQGVTVTVTLPYRVAENGMEEREHEHQNLDSGRRTAGAPANSCAPVD